jgi:oxaloacetate decarboxylase alpha subunit
MQRVQITETALRDGQQCLWATRMTTAMMLPIAERLDRAGYDAIDLMGSIQFDVCVRYLKENPWERIRLMRERVTRTPLKAGLRSKSLVTFRVLPDDIVHRWVEMLVETGIGKLSVFDALADFDNIIETMKIAERAGAMVGGALVFTESPVHTDEYFATKLAEMMRRFPIHHLMLKDSGGLLTVDRVRTLIPALKNVLGSVPLEVHSHCMTGLAPLVYLESIRNGADGIHTAIAPLANGPSQPATQTIARNLRASGYQVCVDDALVGEVSKYFHAVAQQEGKPLGVPLEYDDYHFRHQLPGGMLTNLQFQLDQAGILDRFDAVLAESVRVREELGWPIMVTPFAQLIVTQAIYNIINTERYSVVPDEVKKYALGYFGRLVAPVHPDVLDRIVERGSKTILREPVSPEPALKALRAKYPDLDDKERLLRFMFKGDQVDEMLANKSSVTSYTLLDSSLSRLLGAVTKLPGVSTLSVHKCNDSVTMRRQYNSRYENTSNS